MTTTAAALLSLILFCPVPPQDDAAPDLSKPDTAALAWANFWMDLQHKSNPFLELMAKGDEVLLPAMTPAAKAKQKEKDKKQKEMFSGNETLSFSNKVQAVEDADGGGKEVTIEVTRTFNKKDWKTKQVTQQTETQPHKFVMVKVGDQWRVKKIFRPCYSCKGTGVCGMCKGTGKRAGGNGPCFQCKGNKVCDTCKGKKFREENLAKVGMGFIKDSVKLEVKPDFSTPQKAAETWIQLERKKELTASQSLGAWVKKVLKGMRKFLAPEVMKTIDESIAKGEEAGTKRFTEAKPKLKSVEEEQDGTAYAVISKPSGGGLFGGPQAVPPGGKAPKERLSRIVLKKTGDQWLVDDVQTACSSCNGKGTCKRCNGTGTNPKGGGKCWSCGGKGKCRWCQGKGWRSTKF